MKIRARISCMKDDVNRMMKSEKLALPVGDNNVDFGEVYKELTGTSPNYGMIADVYRPGTPMYNSITTSIFPIEMFTADYQLLLVVIELDVDENADVFFPRSLLPVCVTDVEKDDIVESIRKNRILKLAEGNKKYTQMIITDLTKCSILGAIQI